jgi:hypothetical protein
MFSQAQYQAVTAKVIGGANEMGARIQQFPPVANRVIMYAPLPDTIKEAIRYLTEKIISLLRRALDKIVEVLKGIAAPVFMYYDSSQWRDISVAVAGMTNGIRSSAEGIPNAWQGAASEAYIRAANAQAAATDRVSGIARKLAELLQSLAVAGLLFYASIALIIAKFIVVETGALAAIASVVGAAVGLPVAVTDVGLTTFLIAVAVRTLYGFITESMAAMTAMKAEAADPTGFPFGHWPKASSTAYAR